MQVWGLLAFESTWINDLNISMAAVCVLLRLLTQQTQNVFITEATNKREATNRRSASVIR